ncbi:MAG: hypothetical protein GXZ02_05045 [Clostridiales bacterium]|nr:hypothetical protein [Clostridiales bacterium]
MSERALILVIAFILLMPMIWLSCRWIWTLVCEEAGVTKQEVRLYRIKINREMNPNRKVYPWMLSHSENPKKLKRLIRLYNACVIPNLLLLCLACANLFSPNVIFYGILDRAVMVMAISPLILSFLGVIHRKIKS